MIFYNLKWTKYAITILFLLTCTSTFCQETFPVSQLKFQKFFASRQGEKTLYSLLGNGFFRTVSSGEEDFFISNWLVKHPNAKVIPVSTMGEGTKIPITYIWVNDGEESLNLLLIKTGVFSGSVMLDSVHFEILLKSTSASQDAINISAGSTYFDKLHPNLSKPIEKPPIRLVSDSNYEQFLQKLLIAQDFASKNKLGIWSDKFVSLRDGEDGNELRTTLSKSAHSQIPTEENLLMIDPAN